ncbi:MAG: hypothetical protein HY235_11305 [Acidobacteria bacterium]|nr:hypothetical protein [Acidobacteriota bacterium]
MSLPPIPPPLEGLGKRPFSFYPPVLGVEHNEWVFQKATWSEIHVVNTKTGMEVWVPRRFLGEVSRIDEPVMIVGLKRELEYKAGALWPHQRRVVEIPKAVNDILRPLPTEPRSGHAGMAGIRLEDGAESRIGKLIAAVLVVGIAVTFLAVSLFQRRQDSRNVTYVPILQQSLGLSAQDDYYAVVRKLGEPKDDRWRSDTGELQYRLLHYPQRGVYVILMGVERDKARYIGALDGNWKAVDAVELPNAGNTRSMLNRLGRF